MKNEDKNTVPTGQNYNESGDYAHKDDPTPVDTEGSSGMIYIFPDEKKGFATIRDQVTQVFGEKVAATLKVNETIDVGTYCEGLTLYQIEIGGCDLETLLKESVQLFGDRGLQIQAINWKGRTGPLAILVLPEGCLAQKP
jgi:hypothetical protein